VNHEVTNQWLELSLEDVIVDCAEKRWTENLVYRKWHSLFDDCIYGWIGTCRSNICVNVVYNNICSNWKQILEVESASSLLNW